MSGLQRGLLVALLLSTLGTLWLYLFTLRQESAGAQASRQPELYIEQPHWRVFAADGRLTRELRAARLEKWAAESRARLIEPRLLLKDGRQARWRAQARSGWIDERRRQLRLEQQVDLQRQAPAAELAVSTDALQFNQTQGLIETDRPVVLTAGNWHFSATGLRAELDRPQLHLQLLGNVRGIHE